jgi:RHH-type proline utilization regulon transcriptional repressor/proline dehydrogenase/delta 1-pyrroline-5-carboxylate dehydrogenase
LKKLELLGDRRYRMPQNGVESRIREIGGEIFRLMATEKPALFDRKWWAGQLMEMAMAEPELKVRLFRFIDVLPVLTDNEQLVRHIREYFLEEGTRLPGVLHTLIGASEGGIASAIAATLLKKNIISFAHTFIAGESPEDAIPALAKIRAGGRTFTVDILGEAALSEAEAERYCGLYLNLIDRLAAAMAGWQALPKEDKSPFPSLNVSIKLSSLYSRIGPVNHADSVAVLTERLRPLLRLAREKNCFINLDMEMYSLKELTIDLYTALLSEPEFAGWEGCGLALQAYLKDTRDDISRLAEWGKANRRRVPIRLVKGAYWEYETITARQKGWSIPVFSSKQHSDWHFERCVEAVFSEEGRFILAAGTHNVRSIAALMAMAEKYAIPRNGYELQMLYGMAEPVKHAMASLGFRVREYAPVGELLPGMAYLVRRLLENSSNEGFLRKTFSSGKGEDELLSPPEPWSGETSLPAEPAPSVFRNEPFIDFSIAEKRRACAAAISAVRRGMPKRCPLIIGSKEHFTDHEIVTHNPADPEEVVGKIASALPSHLESAVDAARTAQPAWERVGFPARAEILFAAASIARERRLELIAWQVLETGKGWVEADADVAEAIDYLEYYGREVIRLGRGERLGGLPGEDNLYHYRPRGISTVIAPWNFPLAISVGMISAALVAGNAVLYKPSSLSAVNGWQACRLFLDVGLPSGLLNFLPGRGDIIGDPLVEHPEVAMIAFTGSREVGLRIIEKAAQLQPGQRHVKRAITEMGGKNAIIVDSDADLDQAVAGVMQSAFSYQGQKCSACSRVIVLDPCYDRFVQRLAEAVKSIACGPAEDPASSLGPLIDAVAREKVLSYQRLARGEGTVVAESAVPEKGHFAPAVVVADLPKGSAILSEEVFGPLLAIIRASALSEAISIANESDYALTGGLYSRSPASIRMVTEQFLCGNLYINRPITGAMVGRQPFGGFRLSGVGSKAGGPDYLLQFLEPRVVTENTMRRGFSPEVMT